MRHFFITVLGVVFGIIAFFIVLFGFFIALGVFGAIGESMKPKPSQILSLDLRKSLPDHGTGDTLFGESTGIVDVVRKLDAAKSDERVKGLFIRADAYGMNPASAEELRLAIQDFKSSGKFVVAHAQGFESPSLFPYMTVAGADEVWMQDTSGFAVSGIYSEREFFGGVMEKLEAKPQFEKFHEYKTAVNSYTETGFTEPHRESSESYLNSLYSSAIAHIAEDRDLQISEVTARLNASPHSAEDAMAAGLVDKMGYLETAKEYVKDKAGKDSVFLSVENYELKTKLSNPAIAFIGGEGAITSGSSNLGGPFNGNVSIGGDTLAKAIDSATKDSAVKAIILRVSSPGGSPSASDQILAAAERAQDAGKPVIVSMGQYAASGGYYISASADKIVAMPTTITGSIGVYGGKLALEDTFAKIGYNVEGIKIGGDFAGAFSADTPFSEQQRTAYRGQLEDIYEDFTSRVANGRNMSIVRVKEIAKGRVWTGEQAKERGLVDELGGIMTAIDVAKDLAGIDANVAVRLKRFPKTPSTSEQLERLFGNAAQMQQDISTLKEITALPEVQAVLRARESARIGEELRADIPEIE